MSEFSESYHLRSGTIDAGLELLQSARLAGFLFPPSKDWVTILPAGELFVPHRSLLAQNHGLLLRYFFAEDHGWGFSVHRGAFPAGSFEVSWSLRGVSLAKACSAETLSLLLPRSRPSTLARLVTLINCTHFATAVGEDAAHAFAKAIGLTNYVWLSYRWAADAYGDPAGLPPGTVLSCTPRYRGDQHPALQVGPPKRARA